MKTNHNSNVGFRRYKSVFSKPRQQIFINQNNMMKKYFDAKINRDFPILKIETRHLQSCKCRELPAQCLRPQKNKKRHETL